MAEAGNVQAGLGLPGLGAAQWPLQRYGRFMPSGTGEPPVPDLEAGTASSPTWKVFDSNEESGYLVLTIVVSGHLFISQGQTLLEGFSLIDSKNWLKIVRRVDCLLFGTTIKSKSRMFRVQFSGESKEQALEHCCSCVQSLAQYITVQVPDGIIRELRPSPGPLRAGESHGQDCAESVPLQHGLHQSPEQGQRRTPGTSAPEERASVTQLAQLPAVRELWITMFFQKVSEKKNFQLSGNPNHQHGHGSTTLLLVYHHQSILASEKLSLVYEQSAWDADEIGPFLRLCLMDQNFPAFVEEVEKELKKLTGFSR